MATLLVIEDDDDLRFSVARSLRSAGHEVEEAATLSAARSKVASRDFDIILTDFNLGADDGIAHVGDLRSAGFAGGIIVMTGFGSVELAVRAMKLGADDFLEKPVKLDELVNIVSRLADRQTELKRLRLFERAHRSEAERHRPLGSSTVWKSTLDLAERLAQIPLPRQGSNSPLPTLLLLGETGVGKGVIARHIHQSGSAANAPFVHINCSALPPQLVEGELFGHEKGAFTDARESREGLFEMADGGSIFLDEVGDLPIDVQTKLLTVLERGQFRRVGGNKERTFKARVIAATNRDLEQAVNDGQFRRDLLYRLNAFVIRIPALRDRGSDALDIARASLDRFRTEFGLAPAQFSPHAEQVIVSRAWAGNVRELLNAVQRAAMLSEHPIIDVSDLGLDGSTAATPNTQSNGQLRFDFTAGTHKAEDVERELMVQALAFTRGNVSRAARLIGMQRSSFRYRIERYGLEPLIEEIAGR